MAQATDDPSVTITPLHPTPPTPIPTPLNVAALAKKYGVHRTIIKPVSRRWFLGGLIAAPVIVAGASAARRATDLELIRPRPGRRALA